MGRLQLLHYLISCRTLLSDGNSRGGEEMVQESVTQEPNQVLKKACGPTATRTKPPWNKREGIQTSRKGGSHEEKRCTRHEEPDFAMKRWAQKA